MKRIAIDTRVSTDQQTVENRHRELESVAERMGWEIVAIFSEQAASRQSLSPKPTRGD